MRAVCIAIVGATVLAAQDTNATLSGEIRPFPDGIFPGLNVELTLEQGPSTIFSVRADDDGRFKFTLLLLGSYTLTVAQLGFGTVTVKSIHVARGEQKVLPLLRLYVTPTEVTTPVPKFLKLRSTDQHAGNLSGRVMRDERTAIARAKVQLICDEMLCGETSTVRNGEFIFFNLSPREDYVIRATHSGYYPWQCTDYKVLAGYDATYGAIVLPRRTKLSRAASTVR